MSSVVEKLDFSCYQVTPALDVNISSLATSHQSTYGFTAHQGSDLVCISYLSYSDDTVIISSLFNYTQMSASLKRLFQSRMSVPWSFTTYPVDTVLKPPLFVSCGAIASRQGYPSISKFLHSNGEEFDLVQHMCVSATFALLFSRDVPRIRCEIILSQVAALTLGLLPIDVMSGNAKPKIAISSALSLPMVVHTPPPFLSEAKDVHTTPPTFEIAFEANTSGTPSTTGHNMLTGQAEAKTSPDVNPAMSEEMIRFHCHSIIYDSNIVDPDHDCLFKRSWFRFDGDTIIVECRPHPVPVNMSQIGSSFYHCNSLLSDSFECQLSDSPAMITNNLRSFGLRVISTVFRPNEDLSWNATVLYEIPITFDCYQKVSISCDARSKAAASNCICACLLSIIRFCVTK